VTCSCALKAEVTFVTTTDVGVNVNHLLSGVTITEPCSPPWFHAPVSSVTAGYGTELSLTETPLAPTPLRERTLPPAQNTMYSATQSAAVSGPFNT
jgi:hypothetical protein